MKKNGLFSFLNFAKCKKSEKEVKTVEVAKSKPAIGTVKHTKNNNFPKDQNEQVIRHLQDFKTITPFEAFTEYGITRLASVVHKLRHKKGFVIYSETIKTVNRYGNPVQYSRYSLGKTIKNEDN